MAVVISGIGIVSALGVGVEANRAALLASADGLRPIQHFATRHHVPAGEVSLSNDELQAKLGFDGRSPISRTSLLGMLAALEALADAGVADRQRVAFVSATTVGGMDLTPEFFRHYMTNPNSGRLRYVAQHDCASSTEAIRSYCQMGGFSTAISTACSSSANAIMMGARLIEQGFADCVVAGGTDALCAFTLNGFKSLMILDDAKCRPFDATRAGLNLGEGAAYVVLQSSTRAHKCYCHVAGYANANDAHHQTAITAEGRGPQAAMRGAIAKAGISASDVSYINAHGTGTPNNDASESAAIAAIWGNSVPAVSSTKAFTGHTLAAAGAIEAVFSVLAMQENMAWANLNYQQPMPDAAFEPLRQATAMDIRYVLSNSFGFGGNCSSILFAKP